MNTEIISKYYKNVINWNAITGNDIENEPLRKVYINLVDEETEETVDGLNSFDQIEFVDGLIDSLVVGSYLYALKTKSNFDTYTKREFIEVDIKSSVEQIQSIKKENLIYEKIDSILEIYENLFYTLKNSVNVFGAFQEVLDSNWSKFPNIELVNPEEEVKFIENQGRYKGVVYTTVKDSENTEKYVFRDENGKILKPSTFKEPKLEQYIQKNFL